MNFRIWRQLHRPFSSRVMSSQESIARLAEPLRKLVLLATKDDDSAIFGTSEQDAAEVETWIDKASKADIVDAKNIKVEYRVLSRSKTRILILCKALDTYLVSRTFLVSNYLTAADVAVYGALHPTIVCL